MGDSHFGNRMPSNFFIPNRVTYSTSRITGQQTVQIEGTVVPRPSDFTTMVPRPGQISRIDQTTAPFRVVISNTGVLSREAVARRLLWQLLVSLFGVPQLTSVSLARARSVLCDISQLLRERDALNVDEANEPEQIPEQPSALTSTPASAPNASLWDPALGEAFPRDSGQATGRVSSSRPASMPDGLSVPTRAADVTAQTNDVPHAPALVSATQSADSRQSRATTQRTLLEEQIMAAREAHAAIVEQRAELAAAEQHLAAIARELGLAPAALRFVLEAPQSSEDTPARQLRRVRVRRVNVRHVDDGNDNLYCPGKDSTGQLPDNNEVAEDNERSDGDF